MNENNTWTIEQGAFDVIKNTLPILIPFVKCLLLRGQTHKQITDFIARRNVFLAGMVEMALPIIQENINKSATAHPPLPDPCKEKEEK